MSDFMRLPGEMGKRTNQHVYQRYMTEKVYIFIVRDAVIIELGLHGFLKSRSDHLGMEKQPRKPVSSVRCRDP